MLSVKVKTKISTIADAGEFSKEELLVKSHDLINSDAVDYVREMTMIHVK